MSPYTYAYEANKSVQASTSYANPDTEEAPIMVQNEAIYTKHQTGHTLVNPNKIHYHIITVQDNPFANFPVFISTKDLKSALLMVRKGTGLGVATRTPTDQDIHNPPHIILS